MKVKQFLYTALFCLIFLNASLAQVPNSMNYQAVLRDLNGDPISGQVVDLRFTILYENSAEAYKESHNLDLESNANGLVNVSIGNGDVLLGTFQNIDWAHHLCYLKTEINTGSGWIYTGTELLRSVPYALTSKKATNMSLDDLTDVNYEEVPVDGQVLMWSDFYGEWTPLFPPSGSWETDNGNNYVPAGNVGIGTATPVSDIHIHDESNSFAGVRLSNNNTGSSLLDGSEMRIESTGNLSILNMEPKDILFGTGFGAEKMRLTNGGFLGIGTSNPQRHLHIHTDSGINSYAQFTNVAYGNLSTDGAFLGLASDGNFQIVQQENKPMNFYTNGSNRMTISNTGDVGIGDTSPDAKLDVAGTVQASSVKAVNLAFGGNRAVYADTNGELQVAPSNIQTYSIPACEFRVSRSDQIESVDALTNFEIENSPHMFDIQEDGFISYYAPIHLPQGAHVTGWTATAYDASSDKSLKFILTSSDLYSGEQGSDVAFGDFLETSGSSGLETLTSTYNFVSQTVDNAYSTYYVQVFLNGSSFAPGGNEMKIVSVSISYQLYP